MVQKEAIKVLSFPEDEDYLASVYFYLLNDEYFTICRNIIEKDVDIYLEMNDQAFGTYSNNVDYKLQEKSVEFTFSPFLSKELNLPDIILKINFELGDKYFTSLNLSLKNIFLFKSEVSAGNQN